MNWYITLNIDEVVKQLKFKGSIEGCLEYITDFLLTYQIMRGNDDIHFEIAITNDQILKKRKEINLNEELPKLVKEHSRIRGILDDNHRWLLP